MWVITFAIAASCAGCAGSPRTGSGAVDAIPKSENHPLFQRPSVSEVKVAPDGSLLAMIIEAGRQLAFFRIADNTLVATTKLPFELRASPSEDNIFTRIEWVSEVRIVAEVARYEASLIEPEPRAIIAVDVANYEARFVFGPYAPAGFGERMTGVYGTIGGVLKTPDHIWVHALNPSIESLSEVYDVDVVSGERKLIADGPRRVVQYFLDEEGDVRGATVLGDEGAMENYQREGEEWKKLDLDARVLGYSALRRTLYAVDEDNKGQRLFALELDSNKSTVVAQHPRVEPKNVLFDPRDGGLVAVEFEPDYPVWKIIEGERPQARMIQLALSKYPGGEIALENMTPNGKLGVVRVRSDRSPGEYVLVNLAANTVTSILKLPAPLDDDELGSTEAFRLRASDGVELHGYLTLPSVSGRAADANHGPLPMVVLPHAGPRLRDHWSFDPQAQFFASQGFVVLRVNYRGSAGYGARFVAAAVERWGDRLPDDVIEATRWAINEKIADPKRICTFGAGFGGYVAVQATVRAPELFRCAVGYSGFYDLVMLAGDLEGGEPRRKCTDASLCRVSHFNELRLAEQKSDLSDASASMARAIGSDEAKQRAGSPAHNIDSIVRPILLMHGDFDLRTVPSHARSFAAAMKVKRKEHEIFIAQKERHGFGSDKNRTEAHQRALGFIRKHTR